MRTLTFLVEQRRRLVNDRVRPDQSITKRAKTVLSAGAAMV